MPIEIIEQEVTKKKLVEIAKERFGDLLKAVVDTEKRIMTIGGDLHSDGEAMLLNQGSRQQDLWGINIYPEKSGEELVEFDSMINLRPSQGNFSRGVENAEIQKQIIQIVNRLIIE